MDSQCLISVSCGQVWQWDISSDEITPIHSDSHITLSLGWVQAVLCQGVALVPHFDYNQHLPHPCLRLSDRLIAVASGGAIKIWDITGSDPHLIRTYFGHNTPISSLVFSPPSSLISSYYDKKIRFWQIGDLLVSPAEADLEFMPLASAPINLITLQTKDGIAISVDSDGMVKIWDILTGHCKTSFQTPAKKSEHSDDQLINSRLIYVWSAAMHEYYAGWNVHIWDAERGERILATTMVRIQNVRISGDGSRVYWQDYDSLQALSILTGESMGAVRFRFTEKGYLTVDGSRVWLQSPYGELHGWDFGIPGSSPVELIIAPPALNSAKVWHYGLSGIQDKTTGRVVFLLGGRFLKPDHLQWDGQYLVAGYRSGEVLILDFSNVLFQW